MAKLKSGTRVYGNAIIDSLLQVGTINKVTITSPETSATLTLAQGSTLATSGAFSTTLTSTGTTNVTLPTSGTLVTAAETLSSSTSSTQSGYFGNIFLFDDSTPSHYLGITNSANLTATRTLSINVNDANRTISLSGNLTLANNFTTSGNFGVTLTATNTTSVTLPTSGTLATTGNLSQFATTTSSQLAGVISDETGSGALVFATSPTLTTPILGNATSTTLTVGNRSLTNSYNCWSETGSGAMGILGHNARSGVANNTVVANVSSWHGHFIRMYHSDGIAIHTTTATVTAGDVLYDQSTPANQIASAGERIRITPAGNVGVGLTNPSEKLDVNGTVKATAFSGSIPVSIAASATDVLSYSSNTISGVDAASDKLIFWDDSASKITYLTLGSGLSITGTTITATGGGGGGDISITASAADILSYSSSSISGVDPNADRIVFWDDSASKLAYLSLGSGLSISGTTITATGGSGGSFDTGKAVVISMIF